MNINLGGYYYKKCLPNVVGKVISITETNKAVAAIKLELDKEASQHGAYLWSMDGSDLIETTYDKYLEYQKSVAPVKKQKSIKEKGYEQLSLF